MKLKMIRGPRPGQKDMVLQAAGATHVAELGQTLDVSDAAGHEIMTQWPKCFEVVAGAPAPAAVEPPAASSVEADAAAEATKAMSAKDYSKKKV